MHPKLLPGRPYPLGATPSPKGTNFALYSENATSVQLCLFDDAGNQTDCFPLTEHTAFVWHGLVLGVQTGQIYGYRVDGPWEPEKGLRFNASKLLVDPYAEAITGVVDWHQPIFPYKVETGNDLDKCDQDSAPGMPKAVVVDRNFDWEGDSPPETPLADSIIYEVHVKGYSIKNPLVPENIRGTYAGLAHEHSINYLKKLGITAVELLPIHHFIDDGHLIDQGLSNYWGYNTLGYFAPMARYSSSGDKGGQVKEFKEMVKALHKAGIEVILDVVYNHTCEGNHLGPMLSLKGVDNTTYYRTVQGDPRHYMDYTGTGNTLNVYHPQVLKLLMDSLRYWVTDMHVDGFRFDLAATLARELHDVNKLSAFFDTIHQDPILADIKLIAEPWDVGEGGYQVGQFPILWAEWNGMFRDTVRKFWKGDEGQLSDFAYRLTGSSDLYQNDGRKPYASINFITAHDGFTLCDLVSFNDKHNEANQENNNDGANDNASWNMGAEGPTGDENINLMREQQTRNFLATLMLSQGVPMLTGGDEVGRSQRGNNNPYSLDDEAAWLDWRLDDTRRELLAFAQQLIALRGELPGLRRKAFFEGAELSWRRPDGEPMTGADWQSPQVMALAMLVRTAEPPLIVLMSAEAAEVRFRLPEGSWEVLLDTRATRIPFAVTAASSYAIEGRSFALLRAIYAT